MLQVTEKAFRGLKGLFLNMKRLTSYGEILHVSLYLSDMLF
jgi:hypothetical protein